MAGDHDDSRVAEESSVLPSEPTTQGNLLTTVDPEIVKAVVKPLLGMAALVFLLLIFSSLPGLERFIPATPITFAALIIALLTFGIVGVLVYVAPHVAMLVQQKFGAANALATNGAAIVKHLVLLVAVFVAHWGLSGALLPFFSDFDTVWVYDTAFLLLALLPTLQITRHLYRSLDPAAELLTRQITTGADVDGVGGVDGYGSLTVGDAGAQAARRSPRDASHPSASNAESFFPKLQPDALKDWFAETVQGEATPPDEVLTKQEHVLRILEEHDGRVPQTAIVELTGWSKSTVSRVLSEMSDDDVIVKTNLGQGNLISLPGAEPEGLRSDDPEPGP